MLLAKRIDSELTTCDNGVMEMDASLDASGDTALRYDEMVQSTLVMQVCVQ